MDFRWYPDESPPPIEAHSKAKLDVLRQYLRAYFDRLNVSPLREEFKLDLVDGFAGGGTFRDDDEIVSGTPLIMLEESKAAKTRLNRKRTKPLNLDCKYYFVDKESAHVDHLRRVLNERGFRVDDESIVVRNERFEEAIDDIIAEIRRRQPRAGRSIFLLDQTGFSQVKLELIARIFRELPAAEVILTFAADALVNHLAKTPLLVKAVAPLELTESRMHELVEQRDGYGGRALVQRTLRDHIRAVTHATYDTPFFVRPQGSRRALWFLHLSRHPTARDVMIQRHWDISNTFVNGEIPPHLYRRLSRGIGCERNKRRWVCVDSKFTPYVGFGVGVGQVSLDFFNRWTRNYDDRDIPTFTNDKDIEGISEAELEDREILNQRVAGTTTIGRAKLSDTLFGYQAIAGVDYRVSEPVTIGLKFQWADFGEFEDGEEWDQLRSHESTVRPGGARVRYTAMTEDIQFWGVSLNMKYQF